MSNLDEVLKKLNKSYGANTVMVLGDMELPKVECISTGSLRIDKILGGGIACGRITELFGTEGAGKSSLALQITAECQKMGKKVVYIDSEQAVDLAYAAALGVNVPELIFTQPSSAEQCLDIACQFAECKEVGLIIIDSIGSLCPQAELDGEMSDMTIGLIARLMSKFCRKITAMLNESGCALLCINQIREKISTGWGGGGETTTGGRALKFFASQRIELKKSVAIKEGDTVIGNEVKLKAVKNKICSPMQTCIVPLVFGKGFSAGDEVIELALEYELIEKSGGWYTTHDGQRLNGMAKVKEYYQTNKELAEDLRNKVIAKFSDSVIQDYEVDPETGEILD